MGLHISIFKFCIWVKGMSKRVIKSTEPESKIVFKSSWSHHLILIESGIYIIVLMIIDMGKIG